jgi:hypothetical protein
MIRLAGDHTLFVGQGTGSLERRQAPDPPEDLVGFETVSVTKRAN